MTAATATETTKTCTKCGETKALEEFGKQATGRLGRRARCKPCMAAAERERYTDPAAKATSRERNRRWCEANAEARLDYYRRYHAANAGARREYSRRWREANADAMRGYQREYRQRPETKASNRLAAHRRRAILHGAETDNHTMADLLSYWDSEGIYMCVDCGGPLDDDYEIDHVMPLIRGGTDTVDNKVPLCVPCHATKLDRCPYEFYASRYESLAPFLTPFVNVRPKLTEDEVQARVNAYEARDRDAVQ
ncbi:HNH endonuclease [Streptomyces diastaticus]|uniref:HNH endonuclease n=1 Tax=Streptomyces diastaticus TaxID=1956 RepID=UPI00382E30A2